MSGFVVLRPEPGNARTAGRLEATGHPVIRLPLFAVQPIAWDIPDLAGIDAVLLTSANALRHGGDGLAALRHLPVVAVGRATADAALAAGFTVAVTGERDAAAAIGLAADAGFARLLHLVGRDQAAATGLPTIVVYAADPLPVSADALAGCRGKVALLHSTRAAKRFADLCDPGMRAAIAIAAISPGVAAAAGDGWRHVAVAAMPTDDSLIHVAGLLAD